MFYLGLECANCVLQWRYIAGNNWGMCPDGTGAVGCGAQEEFRACADINIGDVGPQPPLRPMRPGTKTTPPQQTTPMQTKQPETGTVDETSADEQGPRYLGILIAILSLLLAVCVLATIYLYTYHGQRIKHLMHWKKEHGSSTTQQQHSKSFASVPSSTPPSSAPPVPPPRTKRLSQSMQEINPNESSVLNGSTYS